MPTIIHEYHIILSKYHDEIVAVIRYRVPGESSVDSNVMSLREIPNLLALWKADRLLGSFGIGTQLSDTATFTIEEAT